MAAPTWLTRFGSLYAPDPAARPLQDAAQIAAQYRRLRVRAFLGFFCGYAVLYLGRKNISSALGPMGDDLHMSNTELGVIGTVLYVTYGLGKFGNGVLADRANIRRFMATALIISGGLNLWFGTLTSLWALAFVWGLNGWFQSMGFPPIARGMTLWFPPEGKTTRWAYWTCSHQAGTAAVFWLCAFLLWLDGWRACFFVPGLLCIAGGLALLLTQPDTPSAAGLPPIRAFVTDGDDAEAQEPFAQLFFRRVLANPRVWVIGLIDLCIYVVRYGTLDWTAKFLVETKGYSAPDAALRVGVLPAAGVAGVLASGWISDGLFKGRYRVVTAFFIAALGACMFGFLEVGPHRPWLDLVFLMGIGFFVEGPQSILGGVGAVDAGGSARVASSSAGLVGVLAYTGASLSGVGSGFAVDHFGWSGAFAFWIGCALVGLLLCLFAWREAPR